MPDATHATLLTNAANLRQLSVRSSSASKLEQGYKLWSQQKLQHFIAEQESPSRQVFMQGAPANSSSLAF